MPRLSMTWVGVGLICAMPAFGQFTPISQPNGTYTSGTTVISIPGANGTSVSSLTSGALTVTLSTSLEVRTVPGGGWTTWGAPPDTESSTPKIIAIYTPLTSETLTLSSAQTQFGFELEPEDFGIYSVTADFYNGATLLGSITRSVNGSAGARLFAASSTPPITSVVLTVPAGAAGFALGQFRFATPVVTPTAVGTPALGPLGISALALALLATGVLLARRQSLNNA
jgi:hypothetical protein